MRYQRLDLNLLMALRALLAERNVTRAGEAVHVSQSAMSGMLARLREYFDDPLIVPVGRRMALTPLAEGLAERINDLMLQLDATLTARPQFDPASSTRQFSVIASDYVVEVLMVGVLRELHRSAPGLTIEFRPPSAQAGQALENGEVDLLVSPVAGRLNQPQATLFEDSFHALVDRDNAQIGSSLTLEQYLSCQHVSFENSGRALFESWFTVEHGLPPRVQVVVNTFAMLPRMVLGTDLVATMHTRLARQAAQAMPLRLVRLDFETPRFVEKLYWHSYRDDDPGSRWLRERIVAHAQHLPPL
ncbi:MAG: LysR family transcriptional regulator [Comamonas sp.]